MKQKNKCPLCESGELSNLYQLFVPVLQNRVYKSREAAITSGKGEMLLTWCSNCRFVFNASFNDQVIVYDENYDNNVPSQLFHKYYEQLVDFLYKKYELQNGCVYDIGCGKGSFLKLMCSKYPDVKGIGIDPSYDGDLQPGTNCTFIRDFFQPAHVTEKPDLVLSRHVFEHIEYPVSFLKVIQDTLKGFTDIPLFIEVPDFRWIVKNETFWDICYEHCNYFSGYPLSQLFAAAGIRLTAITPAFGSQYLWVEGVMHPSHQSERQAQPMPSFELNEIIHFIKGIESNKLHVQEVLTGYKKDSWKVAVWGMATKGVIFSIMVDPRLKIIDYCIDINEAKQHQYIPASGHLISAPSILKKVDVSVLVIIMNLNYVNEIKQEALTYCRDCGFIDAHGNKI